MLSFCVINGWLHKCVTFGAEHCSDVQDKCRARIGCGMALYHFYIGCDSVLSGKDTQCTNLCKKALVSLLSTEDDMGMKFVDCDCNNELTCLEQKPRIEMCTVNVLNALKNLEVPDKQISCTLAKWVCEADASCQTAIMYYTDHCSSLFRGEKCTEGCNNSLHILYQQEKAKKLETCHCEGDEGFDCYKIRVNTNRLCFNREPPYPSDTTSSYYYNRHGQHSGTSDSQYVSSLYIAIVPLIIHIYLLLYQYQ